MQELDDIRNRLKTLAKDLSAISRKYDDEFDGAVNELEDAFNSITDTEADNPEATPTEASNEKRWFD